MRAHFLIVLLTIYAYSSYSCRGNVSTVSVVNQYRVTINKDNLRKVKVEAELNVPEGRLSMDWPAANSVEKGWSYFVENLKVYDMNDEPIDINYLNKATWQLNTATHRVKITYTINITHDSVEWREGGHSAAAYVVEEVAFLIGAALFIASPDKLKRGTGQKAIIFYDLPQTYDVVVPWKERKEKKNSFMVNSTFELVRTAMLLGNLKKAQLNFSGMEVIIATAKDFELVIPMFQSIYEEIVPALQSYFKDTQDEKYIVIANKAPRTEAFQPYFSGEALNQSMSLISPIIPTEEYMLMFWYILTHEYVHIWNGSNLQFLHEDQAAWFGEGFTDYIAWGLLHQLEKIPLEIMINGVQMAGNPIGWGENIKKYLIVAGKLSLRDAGKSKQDNYDLVYSGGSLFALLLDIEMNNATNGNVGIHELMIELNIRFGKKNNLNKQLDYPDIKNVTSELSETNFDYFFDAYADGINIMPIKETLQKAGLLIQNEGKANQEITIDPNATSKQKLVFRSIIEND